MKYNKPIKGNYKLGEQIFNNPKRIYMEQPKKKFNWAKLWEIIKSILIALLTAETATRL